MRIIYITAKDFEEAKKISFHLLNKKLIGCSNLFPIKSFYFWEEKMQEDNEYVILAKTKDGNYKKIEKEIKKIHSYKIPAIYSWKVDKVNKDYLNWLSSVIS